ncbi:MAG: OmpA/MotB family protein [Planctomycetota bacterium]
MNTLRGAVGLGALAVLLLATTGCQTAAERQLQEQVDHLNQVNMNYEKQVRELMSQVESSQMQLEMMQEDLRGRDEMIAALKEKLGQRPTGYDPLSVKQRQRLRAIAERIGGSLIGNRILLPGDFLFASGSWSLRPDAKRALGEISTELDPQREQLVLMLVGHTDNEPIKKLKAKGIHTNRELSLKRSMAVLEYMRDHGDYPRELMYPTGWGELKPLVSNDSKAGRAKNRRVELWIDPILSNLMAQSAITGVAPAGGAPAVLPPSDDTGGVIRVRPAGGGGAVRVEPFEK